MAEVVDFQAARVERRGLGPIRTLRVTEPAAVVACFAQLEVAPLRMWQVVDDSASAGDLSCPALEALYAMADDQWNVYRGIAGELRPMLERGAVTLDLPTDLDRDSQPDLELYGQLLAMAAARAATRPLGPSSSFRRGAMLAMALRDVHRAFRRSLTPALHEWGLAPDRVLLKPYKANPRAPLMLAVYPPHEMFLAIVDVGEARAFMGRDR